MARCFCPCHTEPGVYPPPCHVCGHDTREGRLVGTIRDGWEPNVACGKSLEFRDGVTCSPFRTGDICQNHRVIAGLRKHAEDADRFESALRIIARGVWTAPNSVETIVYTARQALKSD